MLHSIIWLNSNKSTEAQKSASLKSILRCSDGEDYELIKVYTKDPTVNLKRALGQWIYIIKDNIILEDLEWLYKLRRHRRRVISKVGNSIFCVSRKTLLIIGYPNISYKKWIDEANKLGVETKDCKINYKKNG